MKNTYIIYRYFIRIKGMYPYVYTCIYMDCKMHRKLLTVQSEGTKDR